MNLKSSGPKLAIALLLSATALNIKANEENPLLVADEVSSLVVSSANPTNIDAESLEDNNTEDQTVVLQALLTRVLKQINAIDLALEELANAIKNDSIKVDDKNAIRSYISTMRNFIYKVRKGEIVELNETNLSMLFDINKTLLAHLNDSLNSGLKNIAALDEIILLENIRRTATENELNLSDLSSDLDKQDKQIQQIKQLSSSIGLNALNRLVRAIDGDNNVTKCISTVARRTWPYAALALYWMVITRDTEVEDYLVDDEPAANGEEKKSWFMWFKDNLGGLPKNVPIIPKPRRVKSYVGKEPRGLPVEFDINQQYTQDQLMHINAAIAYENLKFARLSVPTDVAKKGWLGTPLHAIRKIVSVDTKPYINFSFWTYMGPIYARDAKQLYEFSTTKAKRALSYLKGEAPSKQATLRSVKSLGVSSLADRKRFFERELASYCVALDAFNIESLAQQTTRCSYDKLSQVMENAVTVARSKKAGLSQDIIEQSINSVVYNISSASSLTDLDKYSASVYWAGKAFAHILLEPKTQLVKATVAPVTTESGIEHGALISFAPADYVTFATANDIEKECLIELAGIAAQKLVLTDVSLSMASKSKQAVMSKIKKLVFAGLDEKSYSKEERDRKLAQVTSTIERYENHIEALLAQNTDKLYRIAQELNNKLTLSAQEIHNL